jgi:hypothetical protein
LGGDGRSTTNSAGGWSSDGGETEEKGEDDGRLGLKKKRGRTRATSRWPAHACDSAQRLLRGLVRASGESGGGKQVVALREREKNGGVGRATFEHVAHVTKQGQQLPYSN